MRIDDAIKEKASYCALLTRYTQDMCSRTSLSRLEELAELRKFNINTLKSLDIFYVGDMAEMLLPNYLDDVQHLGIISSTNHKPIFRNRWVIPIKNVDNQVENLVGYSPDADERYVYGGASYYRRRETLYGLEKLKLAYELGYAIITEGITDAIRLRDLGYQNSFAMCGTHNSDYIMRQLNRCRHGVIKIPDRDNAGLKASKNWTALRSVTIMVNIQYKDIDEMCRDSLDNCEVVRVYLDSSIEWLKSDTHHGKECTQETVTIL